MIHPLLKLFHICSHMKWAQMPWPGALSDQHPEMMEFFLTMWSKVAAQEKKDRDEQEKKSKNSSNRGRAGKTTRTRN